MVLPFFFFRKLLCIFATQKRNTNLTRLYVPNEKLMKEGAIATLWPLQNAFEQFNSYTKQFGTEIKQKLLLKLMKIKKKTNRLYEE